MMKSKFKGITAKAIVLILCIGVLACTLMLVASASVAEQTEVATLYDASERYMWGIPALSDPVAVNTGRGVYYEPTSYVYFGSYYDSELQKNIPVLNRVLDADKDNAGNEGAIFLLTEKGISAEAYYFFNSNGYSQGIDSENVYTQSRVYIGRLATKSIFSKEDEYYLRAVTKSDIKAEMQELFDGYIEGIDTYFIETDSIPNSDSAFVDAINSDSAEYLKNSKFFLLSAKEIYDYVGAYHGASSLIAENSSGDEIVWWTRTGLGESYEWSSNNPYNKGNFVLGVNKSGELVPVSVDDESVYTRLGFNLEKSNVVYSQRVGTNSYKVAVEHSAYESSERKFSAEIIKSRDDEITIRYSGIVGIKSSSADKGYVTVVIEDGDGNIKYYGNISKVNTKNNSYDYGYVSDEGGEATFKLPEDYDSITDKIVIFWEQKGENQNSVSYVSNRVVITCSHSDCEAATCTASAVCRDCGISFGDTDKNNHSNLSEGFITENSGTHWYFCSDCNQRVFEEACTYGNSCFAYCRYCSSSRHDQSLCEYDGDGLCKYRKNEHFESPTYIRGDWYTRVIIENEGQWLSFANTVNSGETVYGNNGYWVYANEAPVQIELMSSLDFTDMRFIPIGNENYYVKGSLTTLGKDVTIKGISYESDFSCVGLFGHARDFQITGITLTDSSFKGASYVGALVGLGYEVTISETRVTYGVKVSAKDGGEGAFIGNAALYSDGTGKSEISGASVAIDVKNESGKDLEFSKSENVSIKNSFCLFEYDGEDGKTSEKTFASGLIAYKLQSIQPGWTQIIDKTVKDESGEETALIPEVFPRYIERDESGRREETVYRVYEISYCDGASAKLTNNVSRSYTLHKPGEVLEWIWDSDECDAHIVCELCGAREIVVANVKLDYTHVPVRGDYTATILDPDGKPYTNADGEILSDTITIIGIRIESMIGMTNIEMVYNGEYVSPEDLMNNHRLDSGDYIPADKEYEVYFVNPETGEKYLDGSYDWYGHYYEYGASVRDAGVYDLLVVGLKRYEGQSYTFKGALTILPVVIEIEPLDVYKHFDGNGSFEAKLNVYGAENIYNYTDFITVKYSNAPSSAEGVYGLSVSVTVENNSNIQVVLKKDKVQAVILPALYVEVENKNYPTKFTYGDIIPTPSSNYFSFTEGSQLSFEWYKARVNILEEEKFVDGEYIFVEKLEILSMTKIEGAPRDAGEYILRVKASGTQNYAASYCDVVVEIAAASTLSIDFELDKYPIIDGYYVLDMGEEIKYTISGLVGKDTPESIGLDVELVVVSGETWGSVPFDQSKFPNQPNNQGYRVFYYVKCKSGNYENIEQTVCVIIKTKETKPVGEDFIYDGSIKEIDTIFSWTHIEGISMYTVNVTAPDGSVTTVTRSAGDHVADDIVNGNAFAPYSVKDAGKYSVEIYANGELIDSFDFYVTITNEDGAVTNIKEIGRYKVSVEENGNVNSADIYVKREVVMLVKECEYNLDSGDVVFDPTKIVMEAGKVIMLGHTLVDVEFEVNEYVGQISVVGFKVVDEKGNDVSYLYSLNNVYYSWRHNNEDGKNVAHIFDSECDTECNLCFEEYTRVRAHSGGIATCTDLAICEKCNSPYGEYSTTNHVGNGTHIMPNGDDFTTHAVIHSCCGQVAMVLEHTPASEATCIDRLTCIDCGWIYGEVNPDNHASEKCTYAYVDGMSHIATHSCCGATQSEEHKGGEADCKNLAICEHCNGQYGELNPDNHNGHIEYVFDESHADVHLEKYNCCGTSAYVAHTGSPATCISRAICKHCAAEYGEIDPSNHASENLVYTVREDNASMHSINRECCGEYLGKEYHSGGEASCIASMICQRCKTEYGSDISSDKHASDDFEYIPDPNNDNAHIKVHACCKKEVGREEHIGGSESCVSGKICELCSKEYSSVTDHTYENACTSVCSVCNKQTRAESFHTDKNSDSVCDECGAEVATQNGAKKFFSNIAKPAIITGAGVAGGAGGFVLFWFVISKKDFLKFLKFKKKG